VAAAGAAVRAMRPGSESPGALQPVEKPASLGFFAKNVGLEHPAEAGCRETDWGNESPNPLGYNLFAPVAHYHALIP